MNARRGEWDSDRLHELGSVVDVWARWDSDWYLRIAEEGYSWPSSTPAFFPLYPLLVGGAGRPRRPLPARRGHRFPRRDRGRVRRSSTGSLCRGSVRRSPPGRALPRALPDVALLRRRLQRIALPAACAGDVPARRARPFRGPGAAAGLALLTRPAGLALLPALVLFAWRSPQRAACARGRALAPVLFLVYPLAARAVDRTAARLPRRAENRLAPPSRRRPARRRRRGGAAHEVLDLAVAIALSCSASSPGAASAPRTGSTRSSASRSRSRSSLTRRHYGRCSASRSSSSPPSWRSHDLRGRGGAVLVAAILGAWLAVYVVRWALWYWVA